MRLSESLLQVNLGVACLAETLIPPGSYPLPTVLKLGLYVLVSAGLPLLVIVSLLNSVVIILPIAVVLLFIFGLPEM